MLAGRLKIAIEAQSMELNIYVLPTPFMLDTLFLFSTKPTQVQIYTLVCQLDADFSSCRMEHQLPQIF